MTPISAALDALVERAGATSPRARGRGRHAGSPRLATPRPRRAAAFLTALRLKGETVRRDRGPRARVMRERVAARRRAEGFGAGRGRGAAPAATRKGTFNVSTAAAFVRGRLRRDGGQARQPRHDLGQRQRRRAGGAGRAYRPADAGQGVWHDAWRRRASASCSRRRLPPRDAARRTGAAGVGLPHRLQHPGAVDQPRPPHADGRWRGHAGHRRALRPGAGAARRRARPRAARAGGAGRSLAGRPHHGLGAAGGGRPALCGAPGRLRHRARPP